MQVMYKFYDHETKSMCLATGEYYTCSYNPSKRIFEIYFEDTTMIYQPMDVGFNNKYVTSIACNLRKKSPTVMLGGFWCKVPMGSPDRLYTIPLEFSDWYSWVGYLEDMYAKSFNNESERKCCFPIYFGSNDEMLEEN